MTSRTDVWASVASKLSESDAARAETETSLHAENRRQAVRVLAACAVDADEFRMLAEMLGLTRKDIAAAGGGRHGSRSAA